MRGREEGEELRENKRVQGERERVRRDGNRERSKGG